MPFRVWKTDGSSYTWSNMRGGRYHIQERLDRFFSNIDWLSIYSGSHIKNVITSYFNHNCLILNNVGAFESQ